MREALRAAAPHMPPSATRRGRVPEGSLGPVDSPRFRNEIKGCVPEGSLGPVDSPRFRNEIKHRWDFEE